MLSCYCGRVAISAAKQEPWLDIDRCSGVPPNFDSGVREAGYASLTLTKNLSSLMNVCRLWLILRVAARWYAIDQPEFHHLFLPGNLVRT